MTNFYRRDINPLAILRPQTVGTNCTSVLIVKSHKADFFRVHVLCMSKFQLYF